MSLRTLWHAAINIVRTEGVRSLYVRVLRRLGRARSDGSRAGIVSMFKKINVIGFYDFVLTEDRGTLASSVEISQSKTINWLIPDFGIGSGGHLNIFRYIQLLEKRGFKNTVCLVGHHRHSSPAQAKDLIIKHFFPIQADVVFGVEKLPRAHFSFATGWTTAYALKGFGATVHKLYFVQDFEPAFYARGSEYDFAEETYRFGFTGVCAGNWLSQMLETNYAMRSHAIGFSYDRELYQPLPRREPHIRRVFCYCRPPTIRRGLETALLCLDLVGKRLPDVKFVFAGWDMKDYHFPHEHLNAGVLSLNELPDLYSQCDVALVISFTNLSLLPLELMACECVVVSNRGANVEWLLNDANSVLADSAPGAIADAIVRVLEDEGLRAELVKQASNFAHSTSWDAEGEKLIGILEEMES